MGDKEEKKRKLIVKREKVPSLRNVVSGSGVAWKYQLWLTSGVWSESNKM